MTRDAYAALGVRQSIFAAAKRDSLYDLFEKYRTWLESSQLFDLNLIAQQWQAHAAPRYDFVVIDEVQDMTPVQLALVLKTLKKPGHFMLCGDSNQIVHPNFFSWAQVKTLFWRAPKLAERQQLSLLTANFRNSIAATRVANRLLAIKQLRFGSIDRESNFLVEAVGGEAGSVALVEDKDKFKQELNQKIQQTTRFAVLVMRDEDKAEARRHFSTPLLFSVHEAKGLEYENIVLYRFVSDHRSDFGEITAGVAKAEVGTDSLDYRRARDKTDRALEIYKFFTNALYVALTRATAHLFLIESDTEHALFDLLDLKTSDSVKVESQQSSREEWQKEARRLELQGKQEQAEAIRRDILHQTPVPWPIFDQPKITDLLKKVFRENSLGNKPRQQLYEVATCHELPMLARWLVKRGQYDNARNYRLQSEVLGRKSIAAYSARNLKEVLSHCAIYGLEHRLPMNQTPLMAAAASGNVALVEALLERGADQQAVDHFGCNALHWAMRAAFRDRNFAQGPFSLLYERLAPPGLDVNTGARLVRVDQRVSEYFLFQTLWALFKSRFTHRNSRSYAAFDTHVILDAWHALPAHFLRAGRENRTHISSVLSRNEVDRDYAYNRQLFMRVATGWYQFNPALLVRHKIGNEDVWVPVLAALNLPFIRQFTPTNERRSSVSLLDALLAQGHVPLADPPIAEENRKDTDSTDHGLHFGDTYPFSQPEPPPKPVRQLLW